MGMLFAIEGVDGSGKETQTKFLYDRLLCEGKNAVRISFPDYDSDSSYAVKMYLSGQFGKNANDINAKAASTFFALDRYISYKTKWEKIYNGDSIIVADRYVTSNMIHQASKFADNGQKDEFLEWLCDFEYGVYGLPKPDKVIFLDVAPEVSEKLTRGRKNKATGGSDKDIHESDASHIKNSYNNAKYVAKKYGWEIIECAPEGKMRSIEDIGTQIYGILFEKADF